MFCIGSNHQKSFRSLILSTCRCYLLLFSCNVGLSLTLYQYANTADACNDDDDDDV